MSNLNHSNQFIIGLANKENYVARTNDCISSTSSKVKVVIRSDQSNVEKANPT